MDPLRKCIAFPGAPALERDDLNPNVPLHPADYRLRTGLPPTGPMINADYIDSSNTRWVKVWFAWSAAEAAVKGQFGDRPPTTYQEAWQRLNASPQVQRLDRQIRAINDKSNAMAAAGRGHLAVILGIYQSYPWWSSDYVPGQSEDTNRAVKTFQIATIPPKELPTGETKPAFDPSQKVPDDVRVDSPWGWMVANLIGRYTRDLTVALPNYYGYTNNPGPREGTPLGNPQKAWVNSFEVCNEPNFVLWPQEGIACKAAQMMQTGEVYARFAGWQDRFQGIFGPGTADSPDPEGETPRQNTDWAAFTAQVLAFLANWNPVVYTGWTHHNYRDVKYGCYVKENDDGTVTKKYRCEFVRDLLREDWRGYKGDRFVWLTEGGYALRLRPRDHPTDPLTPYAGEREWQERLVRDNYNAMKALPDIPMWTQYGFHDTNGNTYWSGLHDAYVESTNQPGPARPLKSTWNALPGKADW